MAKGSYHVLLGARTAEKGEAALKDLQSRGLPGSAELLLIDVTDDNTIERAASKVQQEHGKLDILVNNAGISSTNPSLRQQMRDSFDTNTTGPAVVTIAFAPLLKLSTSSPRIVNISSGAGSITRRLDPESVMYKIQEVAYRASKTALNMVTACQHVEYMEDGIKVFAYCPGFVVSNIGPYNKPEMGASPTKDGVIPLIDILEGKRDDEAGKFVQRKEGYPW